MVETFILLLIFALVLLLGLAVIVALGALLGILAKKMVGWLLRGRADSAAKAKLAQRAVQGGFFLFIAYLVYTAVYPPDSFYLGEFSLATHQDPPSDAVVVAKDATYPDFHGDYRSFSRIKLSNSSYKTLLRKMRSDSRISYKGEGQHVSTGVEGASSLPGLRAMHVLERLDTKSDQSYTTYFLEDGLHIEVHVSVW